MEQAGRRLIAELGARGLAHALEVAGHMRVIMVRRFGRIIPAVVAGIEDDDLEIREEAAPEREITVAGKAVAMTDDQPVPKRIAVPPQGGLGRRLPRRFGLPHRAARPRFRIRTL